MAVQTLSLLGVLAVLRTGLWGIAVCYGLQGGASAFWPPARQCWLYAQIREGQGRAAANAAIGSVSGVMTIVGATLGGILSAWSTIGALAVAAGLQLAATVPLFALARPDTRHSAQTCAARRSFGADLAEGFAGVRTVGMAAGAASVLAGAAWWSLMGGAPVLSIWT